MMKNDKLKYTNLILKELSGDISEEEQKKLDQWIAESDDFRTFYDEVIGSWKLDSKNSIFDAEAVFNDKFEKNDIVHPERKSEKNRVIVWFARVAAIFIIVFVSLYLFNGRDNSFLIVNSTSDVLVDTLTDGTIIWMNQNSELFVENKFGEEIRQVSVKGEVYFDVTPDKTLPFYVITDYGTVKVIGTEFLVCHSSNDESVEVQVNSGKVQFFNDEIVYSSNSFKTDLVAGEGAKFSSTNGKMIKQKQSNMNYLFWKTGEIAFKSIGIEEVIRELSSLYGVNISSSYSNLDRFRITAKFANKDIDEVINIINSELVRKFKLSNDSLLIYKY